jgi:2,4-dichlorophenol 6-monooxygenase
MTFTAPLDNEVRQREIQSDAAILVRPDRFIAWRPAPSAEDPRSALAGALSQILARSVATRLVAAGCGFTS